MTAFAKAEDVKQALRRDLTGSEAASVATVIAEAQDLLVGYLGIDDDAYASEADVPGAVRRICARMVARVFQQDDGRRIGTTQAQATAGPFSQGLSFIQGSTTGSPWLAASDKIALRPYRLNGGMRSISFRSEHG